MGFLKPSPPKPPDPAETAGAQTANNIGTAIANQVLGSVNQVTPTGSLTYYFNGPNGELIAPGDWQGDASTSFNTTTTSDMQGTQRTPSDLAQQSQMPATNSGQATGGGGTSGAFQYTDPNTGNVYNIPQMTAVQELTPEEQAIFDSGQATRQNMADLSTLVSGQMNDHFATPFTLDGLPEGGSAANIRRPEYQSLQESGGIRGDVRTRADELRRDFGDVSIGAGIGDAGEILREFGDAGEITRTYGTDFSEDRRRVEDALFSRLNPQIDRDRESLRTSLINQGLREGSEAFDRAMNRADEQSTDARMQVILAGGQEQSRLADLEARRAGFENAAQAQQFGQLFNRAQFTNNAQQQQFGQNRDSAALSLQGQIAQANAELARMQAENQATQAAFGMDLSAAQFANNAQQQQFGQNLTTANFGNNLADRNFQNDAFMQDRMDADRQRGIQESLLMRNQPINEIGALLGTGQVSMPNFVNTNSVQMPTVDRAGLEQAAYAQQMAQWQQQQALMGSVLGIGGNIAGAGIGAGYF